MKVKECLGCGFCCLQAPCSASQRLWKGASVCPGLRWDEESSTHRCSLMEIPGKVGDNYRKELYAGEGCCSSLNTWRLDKVINRIHQDPVYEPIDKPFQLFLASLGSEMLGADKIILTLSSFESRMKKEQYPLPFITYMKKSIAHYICQNQRSMFDDFMGNLSQKDIEEL